MRLVLPALLAGTVLLPLAMLATAAWLTWPAILALIGLALLAWRSQQRLAISHAVLEERVLERTAALAESEARLRRVQQIGRVGGFEIDLVTGANHRSAEYMRLQGRLPCAAQERHADWVHRLHPEDRARAEAIFLRAISDGSGETRYAQDYRILTPAGEIRWIAARAEIERDGTGRALRMVGAHVDVTELKAAQAAVAESATRLRAALAGARMGVWERDMAGSGCWDARAAEIFAGFTSDAIPERTDFLARIHPEDRAAYCAAVDAAIAPGGMDHYEVEFRMARPDGRLCWVRSHGAVVERDPAGGHALRLAGVAQDITGQRVAEAERERLLYEVDHRARNALALIVAIMRLTPHEDADRYARAVEGRVTALARLHAALAERNWQEAGLHAVVEAGMAGLRGSIGAGPHARVTVEGPALSLPPAPAQALCMAVHELAANAVLHGALSTPEGSVELTWTLSEAGGGLRLDWRESGGGRPVTPAPAGFGLRMLETTVHQQLEGRAQFAWRARGLSCRIDVPAHVVGAAGRAGGAGAALSPSAAEAVR